MSRAVEVYDSTRPNVIVERSQRRINKLEDRISQQEKTTDALIERAFELKDKLSNKTQSSKMDAALQQLWHEHIRTITNTVQQLNRDVDELKYEMTLRDSHAQDANYQARNIEQFAQAGVTDLRGRVVRCDTSIARLAQDVRNVSSSSQLEVGRLKQTAESYKSKTDQLENQIVDMTRRLDQVITDQDGKMKTIQGSSHEQLEAIDSRIKRILEDIRMTMESNRRWAESERARIEQQLMQIVELNASIAQTKQENFESKILDRIETLHRSVEECKEECRRCRNEIRDMSSKDDILQKLEQQKQRNDSENARLKSEYRDGFESVKESINTTNKLINGKVKLVKDELLREIATVKKMIVLI